jgi:hypothetical protein
VTLWLFLKYDFIVVYKLSKTHVVANVLFRLSDTIEPTRILEQTIDANTIFTKPKWLNDVRMFLQIGQMEEFLSTYMTKTMIG